MLIIIITLFIIQGCIHPCTGCSAKLMTHENLTIAESKIHIEYLVKKINEKDLKAIRRIPDKFNMIDILIRDMNKPNWKGIGSFIKVEENTNLGDLTYYYQYDNSVHQVYFSYLKENNSYKFNGLFIIGW